MNLMKKLNNNNNNNNNNINNNNNNNKQANINVKSRPFGIIMTPFSRQNINVNVSLLMF